MPTSPGTTLQSHLWLRWWSVLSCHVDTSLWSSGWPSCRICCWSACGWSVWSARRFPSSRSRRLSWIFPALWRTLSHSHTHLSDFPSPCASRTLQTCSWPLPIKSAGLHSSRVWFLPRWANNRAHPSRCWPSSLHNPCQVATFSGFLH